MVMMTSQVNPFFALGATSAFFSLLLYSIKNGTISQCVQKLFASRDPTRKEKENQSLSEQFSTRLMSAVHNFIQVPFALYLLLDETLREDPLHGSNTMSTFCMAIAAGYFIIELWVCCQHFKMEGPLYFMHACICFTVYTYGTFSGFLHYYGAGFLLWEVSTPFVQARWLLKHLHMEHTKAYFINGVFMLATFFFFRCVWGSFLSISFWKTSAFELAFPGKESIPVAVIWVYRITNLLLNCLNIFWVAKMVRLALKFLSEENKKKQ